MKQDKWGLIPGHPTPPPGLILMWPKRSCIMLVCESMEACISICTCAKSSIRHSSRHRVFPNQWPGRWWEALHPNQPSQVSSHHRHECEQTLDGGGTCTSPSPRGTDGDVVVVCSHGHVTLCKIMARPCGLIRWWHERRRPRWALRATITGVWARALAGWARRERSLHST
jgi:hypothetical protein